MLDKQSGSIVALSGTSAQVGLASSMSLSNLARRLLKTVLALGSLVLSGSVVFTASAQAKNAYSVIEAVNRLRASRGLASLQVDPSLMTAAQRHVDWMAATQQYG